MRRQAASLASVPCLREEKTDFNHKEHFMAEAMKSIYGRVVHDGNGPVSNAEVQLYLQPGTTKAGRTSETWALTHFTGPAGEYRFQVERPGTYVVKCNAFDIQETSSQITISDDDDQQSEKRDFDLKLGLVISPPLMYSADDKLVPALRIPAGRQFVVQLEHGKCTIASVQWSPPGVQLPAGKTHEAEYVFARPGMVTIRATAYGPPYDSTEGGPPRADASTTDLVVGAPDTQVIGGNIGVTLHRTASDPTLDQALWVAIRNRTHAVSFNRYRERMETVLQWDEGKALPALLSRRSRDIGSNLQAVRAYHDLKFATEAFLLSECGVRIGDRDRNRFDPGQDLERLG
jgi:hypothetical protein